MKRGFSIALALVSSLVWSPIAAAHAFLVRSVPSAGSEVHRSPAKLSLWFSEDIQPAFGTVEILDASEKRVGKGDAQGGLADRKLLEVSLSQLPVGRYRVAWRALSVDTHVSKGEFTFDIAR